MIFVNVKRRVSPRETTNFVGAAAKKRTRVAARAAIRSSRHIYEPRSACGERVRTKERLRMHHHRLPAGTNEGSANSCEHFDIPIFFKAKAMLRRSWGSFAEGRRKKRISPSSASSCALRPRHRATEHRHLLISMQCAMHIMYHSIHVLWHFPRQPRIF
jgi:hypothetical protein